MEVLTHTLFDILNDLRGLANSFETPAGATSLLDILNDLRGRTDSCEIPANASFALWFAVPGANFAGPTFGAGATLWLPLNCSLG